MGSFGTALEVHRRRACIARCAALFPPFDVFVCVRAFARCVSHSFFGALLETCTTAGFNFAATSRSQKENRQRKLWIGIVHCGASDGCGCDATAHTLAAFKPLADSNIGIHTHGNPFARAPASENEKETYSANAKLIKK